MTKVNIREIVRNEKMRICCEKDLKKAVEIIWNGNYSTPLDWDNPKTINEKMQVLKVGKYYNNPVVTRACDKVLVKDYIKEYDVDCKCAKTYATYTNAHQIDWDSLPQKFVIKCNHGSGYNIICRNKDKLDKDEVCKTLQRWMKEDYWVKFVEPQYKYIEKRILIEEYLGDSIHTYKFYCFNGLPKVMYISSDGENGEEDKYYDYYDMDFNWIDVRLRGHENKPEPNIKPENWEKMKQIAVEIAKNFKFIRVDLYSIQDEVYLSELTFIPTGGYMHLIPEKTEEEWGNWLKL